MTPLRRWLIVALLAVGLGLYTFHCWVMLNTVQMQRIGGPDDISARKVP